MIELYAFLIGAAVGIGGLLGGFGLAWLIDKISGKEDDLPDSWTPISDDLEDQYK